MVIGVFDEKLVDLLAGALERIGVVEHAVVIHGVGLDELSPLGPCTVRELKKNQFGIRLHVDARTVRLWLAAVYAARLGRGRARNSTGTR